MATLLAGCMYLFHSPSIGFSEGYDTNIPMLCAYAAALVLLSGDVVQTAGIGRGPKLDLKSPRFWIFAFYTGYAWGAIMVMFFWQDMGSVGKFLVIYGVMSAVLGLFSA